MKHVYLYFLVTIFYCIFGMAIYISFVILLLVFTCELQIIISYQEAKQAIKKSVSLWLPKLQAVDKNDKGTLPDEEFDPVEVSDFFYF